MVGYLRGRDRLEEPAERIAVAESLQRRRPQQIAWATSFNLENWGHADWRDTARETIEQGFRHGAVAVKVWKEIGMVLKDPDGHWVMIDDARFDPLLDYIESQNKTLVAHIGEPRDCWLAPEAMMVADAAGYYKEHPQYYGFLHREIPGYWEQIKARDHVLEKHPHLRVVGCHLGSLEYDVDELAKRLDKYPNLAVDTAARVLNFQAQEREKVRRFLVKYQDRILYGTDNEVGREGSDPQGAMKYLDHVYRQDYRYFGSDQEIEVPEIKPGFKVRGLALPLPLLKKIYYENAVKWYPGIEEQSSPATPANSKAPATSEKPKYLIFWSSPEKAGELAERVGMKGDGKTRLLGFGLPNATYELEEQLPSRIRSAFAAAREHDMAVMLHFDFHLAWKNRPDLWNWFDPDKPGYNPNNKYNVEWHGWDGPPNKVRYLNHGVLERLPPNMCFTSKRMRAEVTRIVSKVIGPVLREEIAKLKAEGKETLFAGVLVGLEPSIDDYSKPNPECMKMMKEDGVPAGPLGYRALLDRGFSADHPPDDFRKALAKIIQETIAFWCEQFVDAGIPAEKLYPHVAAPAPIEVMNAPIWTAFNKYSRPGWTTYAVGVLGESFKPIYDELEKHGNPAWAGVEANAGIPGSVVDWETYLAWHYNHGCVLVGVNMGATGEDLPKRLWDSAFGKEAIAAYRKFLTGQPLVEKPSPWITRSSAFRRK